MRLQHIPQSRYPRPPTRHTNQALLQEAQSTMPQACYDVKVLFMDEGPESTDTFSDGAEPLSLPS